MTTPDRRLLTRALVTTLERATTMAVGLGTTPDHNEREPYIVVYSIPGGELSGPPLSAPDADAAFIYQLDSVARNHEQAEWAGDQVRRTMLARHTNGSFQVPFAAMDAIQVIQRELEGSPGGVTIEGAVFSVVERYTLFVTQS